MSTKTGEITVNLSDEEFLRIAKLAHKYDVTFNQICNYVILKNIKKFKKRKLDGTKKAHARRARRKTGT
jgi:hypothetical protein